MGVDEEELVALESASRLLRFPLYGAVASTVATLVVVGPGLYLIEQNTTGAGVVLLAVGLYVLALVGLYFSVGLAAAADMTFRGERPQSATAWQFPASASARSPGGPPSPPRSASS